MNSFAALLYAQDRHSETNLPLDAAQSTAKFCRLKCEIERLESELCKADSTVSRGELTGYYDQMETLFREDRARHMHRNLDKNFYVDTTRGFLLGDDYRGGMHNRPTVGPDSHFYHHRRAIFYVPSRLRKLWAEASKRVNKTISEQPNAFVRGTMRKLVDKHRTILVLVKHYVKTLCPCELGGRCHGRETYKDKKTGRWVDDDDDSDNTPTPHEVEAEVDKSLPMPFYLDMDYDQEPSAFDRYMLFDEVVGGGGGGYRDDAVRYERELANRIRTTAPNPYLLGLESGLGGGIPSELLNLADSVDRTQEQDEYLSKSIRLFYDSVLEETSHLVTNLQTIISLDEEKLANLPKERELLTRMRAIQDSVSEFIRREDSDSDERIRDQTIVRYMSEVSECNRDVAACLDRNDQRVNACLFEYLTRLVQDRTELYLALRKMCLDGLVLSKEYAKLKAATEIDQQYAAKQVELTENAMRFTEDAWIAKTAAKMKRPASDDDDDDVANKKPRVV